MSGWTSCRTISQGAEKIKKKKLNLDQAAQLSYRTHHLPEKALGVAPELGPPNAIFASLRVIPAKGHQELAA